MLARLIILLTVVFAALIAGAPISVAEPPGPARADHPATAPMTGWSHQGSEGGTRDTPWLACTDAPS
jgi:hypothetical protein